ncbi:hypothetical protein RhiirB3_143517 [Rhizophagus irregularis]|nr:hypothetical protein RhiirB3_143517 [Rhizophagus irregularis]
MSLWLGNAHIGPSGIDVTCRISRQEYFNLLCIDDVFYKVFEVVDIGIAKFYEKININWYIIIFD